MADKKYPGITSPISLAGPKPIDVELSKKLEEAMKPYGTFESDQELAKRYKYNIYIILLWAIPLKKRGVDQTIEVPKQFLGQGLWLLVSHFTGRDSIFGRLKASNKNPKSI